MTALRRKSSEGGGRSAQTRSQSYFRISEKEIFPPTEEQILPDGLDSPEVDQLPLFSDTSKGFNAES